MTDKNPYQHALHVMEDESGKEGGLIKFWIAPDELASIKEALTLAASLHGCRKVSKEWGVVFIHPDSTTEGV